MLLAKLSTRRKDGLRMGFDDTEAEARVDGGLAKELAPGDKGKLTILVLYDSRVPTHNESVDNAQANALVSWLVSNTANQNIKLVKVDVS